MFNRYPYTNFHELNLDYFIQHFNEIFTEWDQLYNELQSWKTDTTEELAQWRAEVETDLDEREAALRAELEIWKQDTAEDISDWETATLNALDAWKTAATAQFEAIRVQAAASAEAAAASQTAAASAAAAALLSETAAEEAAAAIQASAAQIQQNTDDISELKTQLFYTDYNKTDLTESGFIKTDGVTIDTEMVGFYHTKFIDRNDFNNNIIIHKANRIINGLIIAFYRYDEFSVNSFISGFASPNSHISVDTDVVIPDECNYIVFSNTINTDFSATIKYKYAVDSIGGKLKRLDGTAGEFNESIAKINSLDSHTNYPHIYNKYAPENIVWLNNSIAVNGDIGANNPNYALTEQKINCVGFNCINYDGSSINAKDAVISLYDYNGEHITNVYTTKSPYIIINPDVCYFRLQFGKTSAIDITLLGDIITLTKYNTDDKYSHEFPLEMLPFSDNTKKIVLLGDSITQGQGSTGFIIYTDTIDGVNYSIRGNGPNYPNAGADYQVGTYLFTRYSTMWYEAIDGEGWSQKLKKYYESKFNCKVLNYGLSGIDSKGLLSFVNTTTLLNDADIVIIMIGTNDRGSTTKTQFYNNVTEICNKFINERKEVIIMASIPASINNESLEIMKYHMEDVEHILYKVAYDTNSKFISIYEKFLNYCELKNISIDSLLSDGLHPNDEGYTVMFDIITSELGLNRKRPGATW